MSQCSVIAQCGVMRRHPHRAHGQHRASRDDVCRCPVCYVGDCVVSILAPWCIVLWLHCVVYVAAWACVTAPCRAGYVARRYAYHHHVMLCMSLRRYAYHHHVVRCMSLRRYACRHHVVRCMSRRRYACRHHVMRDMSLRLRTYHHHTARLRRWCGATCTGGASHLSEMPTLPPRTALPLLASERRHARSAVWCRSAVSGLSIARWGHLSEKPRGCMTQPGVMPHAGASRRVCSGGRTARPNKHPYKNFGEVAVLRLAVNHKFCMFAAQNKYSKSSRIGCVADKNPVVLRQTMVL